MNRCPNCKRVSCEYRRLYDQWKRTGSRVPECWHATISAAIQVEFKICEDWRRAKTAAS